jgi:hypothetical protein
MVSSARAAPSEKLPLKCFGYGVSPKIKSLARGGLRLIGDPIDNRLGASRLLSDENPKGPIEIARWRWVFADAVGREPFHQLRTTLTRRFFTPEGIALVRA